MPSALFQDALSAHRAGRLDEAAAGYRKALHEQPEAAAAYNLGVILDLQFRFAEALGPLQLADHLRPDNAGTLSAIGGVLTRLHRLEEAETALRRALQLAPDDETVRHRLARALLAQGRYLEAWPHWDCRDPRRNSPVRGVRFPEWQGEDLAGRSILVWGEQGLGDEIQAARFLPQLRALGAATITVACLPPNIRLFQAMGADAVIARTGSVSVPPHDYWVLIWSLPARFGVTLETLPPAPYLSAPAAEGGGIGVAWTGNTANTNDAHRSMPDDRLLRMIPGAFELKPAGDTLDSLAQVAATDLVITVDTAWAHMAGAIGAPCWLLLSHSGVDWRWFPKGPTSPWYPSLRLFWQAFPGDWDGVMDQALAGLAPR